MKNGIIKVLIADGDAAQVEHMKNYISQLYLWKVAATVNNGDDVVQQVLVHQPEVVIIDLVLPGTDGLSVLKQLRTDTRINNLDFYPVIMVLTSANGDYYTKTAFENGADHYMIKPCNMDTLLERARTSVKMRQETFSVSVPYFVSDRGGFFKLKDGDFLNKKVSSMLKDLGIPSHLYGYDYLKSSITYAIRQPDIIQNVTKKLYPYIAKDYNRSTQSVEKAIRCAIEVAWARGKSDIIDDIFGYTISLQRGKPTNTEFIKMVSDRICEDLAYVER